MIEKKICALLHSQNSSLVKKHLQNEKKSLRNIFGFGRRTDIGQKKIGEGTDIGQKKIGIKLKYKYQEMAI